MDIESLEAANQSLQVDLKLAFKRIGDLQAAIEDEMESDDNDDLINRYRMAVMYPYIREYCTLSRAHSLYKCQESYRMKSVSFLSGLSITTCIFSFSISHIFLHQFLSTLFCTL